MTCKMKCKFKGDDPEATMKKIIEEAKRQNFIFKGDINKGTLEYEGVVTAKANYVRSGKNLTIEVTKKPFFVSCERIIDEINKLLAKDLSCKETK